jgi:HK97 gp10 family phage protein
MAKEFELGVSGREAMVANFHAADQIAQVAFKEANEEGARYILKLAERYCPVDTGRMLRLLGMDVTDFTWSVGWDAQDFIDEGQSFYPEFVEFGTRYMEGQYPLTRAYEEGYPVVVEQVSKAMSAAYSRFNAR